VGSSTDTWGRTWTPAELVDGVFRLKVTDVDPPGSDPAGCTDTATTSLDYLDVTVYYTPAPTVQTRTITTNGFSGGTPLPSQGFWGAIEGQGSNRSTGDAYATGYNPHPNANAQYDPLGYDYTIELPEGGSIKIFDPTFCATSSGGAGHYGTGDHWLGTANPVSTYFVLWNTNGSPLRTLHTPTGHSSGLLFENEYQANLITGSDFSDGGEPTNPTDCGEGVITDPNLGGFYHTDGGRSRTACRPARIGSRSRRRSPPPRRRTSMSHSRTCGRSSEVMPARTSTARADGLVQQHRAGGRAFSCPDRPRLRRRQDVEIASSSGDVGAKRGWNVARRRRTTGDFRLRSGQQPLRKYVHQTYGGSGLRAGRC
jgi:hypothetical protein